ncbi:MAG: transglycosylase SLT domain-containing protein [Clostridia bacterium]|jgi:hypothetical protein
MIRGIRSIIKLVAQEVQIPPQYLYGLIMALSEDEEYAHVFIAYDNKNDDYIVGISKIKYKEAIDTWDKYEYDFNKFIGKADKSLATLFDPKINIYICALKLNELYDVYKNWKKVYYVYNIGGDSNIEHFQDDKFTNTCIKYSKRWFAT